MPLRFVVPDDGHNGEDLRRHRGNHQLLGTGPSARLVKLIPSAASSNGDAALLSDDLVDWLSYPLLVPAEDVKPAKFFRFKVGVERRGAALERALAHVGGDEPRAPAVLRAQLRAGAALDRAGADHAGAYLTRLADLYEVAADAPTGDGIVRARNRACTRTTM